MGANTAFLTAAEHPDLVRMLAVIEGSPDGPEPPDPEPAIATVIRESLMRWPVPFPDANAAQRFFAGKGFDPIAWTGGLEQREEGLWPRFEIDTMVACIRELASRDYWARWRTIRCPTLVVLGERGGFTAADGELMVSRLTGSSLVIVPGAGHDVHLDAPQAWTKALAGVRAT